MGDFGRGGFVLVGVDAHVGVFHEDAAAADGLSLIVEDVRAEYIDRAFVHKDAAAAFVGYVAKIGIVTADGGLIEAHCAFFEVDAAAVSGCGCIFLDQGFVIQVHYGVEYLIASPADTRVYGIKIDAAAVVVGLVSFDIQIIGSATRIEFDVLRWMVAIHISRIWCSRLFDAKAAAIAGGGFVAGNVTVI